jgi:monofunctional glycosyltransferase
MTPDEENPEEQAPEQQPAAEEPPQEEPLHEEELSSFASEPAPEEHVEEMAEPPIEEPPLEPAQELPPPEPPPMQHTPPPLHERPRRADFGDAEIPMPQTMRREDKRRARDARANLDLDLGRIKRRKRYGFFLTTLAVLFIAFVLAPVTPCCLSHSCWPR